VLYSDGVTEALDQHGEEFGETRLVDIITAHAGDSAPQLCQAVLSAQQQHSRHTSATDDVTVFVVKRTSGHPGRRHA
jgi:phosphoserine phosphatase RsbU/P